MVHTNFAGNSYGPIIGPYLFLGKFVWTNGPESSSKVPPYTGIGPWMALPNAKPAIWSHSLETTVYRPLEIGGKTCSKKDSCDPSNHTLTAPLSGPVRDIPPYLARPFRDDIAEGGIAPICLVFIGYRASIAEIPLLRGGGGYRTSTSHALQGGNGQKRGRGYRTKLAMLRHQKPHSAQQGGIAEIVSRYRAIRGH